jgi:predicted enzyme related to lactoylglutathione lyase
MKIKLTKIYVDDQEKALRFYTDVLGFATKADYTQGPYRWLTVTSAEEPDGTELQLELNNDPAGKAYQEAQFQQSQPATMFYVDDLQAEYDRLAGKGVNFTVPVTDGGWGKMAILNDTCGNLIQLTQLAAWNG